jgi:hypothetical protein
MDYAAREQLVADLLIIEDAGWQELVGIPLCSQAIHCVANYPPPTASLAADKPLRGAIWQETRPLGARPLSGPAARGPKEGFRKLPKNLNDLPQLT